MATAKQYPAARRATTRDAEGDVAPRRKALVDEVPDELITVTVPKAYTLNADDGKVHQIPVGVQEMLRSHAEHWFSKAHGVEEYIAKTAEQLLAEAKAAEAEILAAAKKAA
jgi:hypothetical protein